MDVKGKLEIMLELDVDRVELNRGDLMRIYHAIGERDAQIMSLIGSLDKALRERNHEVEANKRLQQEIKTLGIENMLLETRLELAHKHESRREQGDHA